MKSLKYIILLFSLTLCFSSWYCGKNKKSKPTFQVTGSIMETRSYCGGVEPSPEMLQLAKTPTGIPMGKLFVKKGSDNNEKKNVIDTIVADASGNFRINLPAGTYCLMEDWKAKKFVLPENNEFQTVDSTCYRNRYDACDYQLTISDKNIDSVKIVFHRNCFYSQPCINYHGPLPGMPQPNRQEKVKIGE